MTIDQQIYDLIGGVDVASINMRDVRQFPDHNLTSYEANLITEGIEHYADNLVKEISVSEA